MIGNPRLEVREPKDLGLRFCFLQGLIDQLDEAVVSQALADVAQSGAAAVLAVAVLGEDGQGGLGYRQDIGEGARRVEQDAGSGACAEGAGGDDFDVKWIVISSQDEGEVVDPGLGVAVVTAAGEGDFELAGQGAGVRPGE